ncbi:cAMP-regulated phosphoprotein 21-like isoform X2 [Limulus polyphemus]|uniref:cAMP-regulated phosphoprotein 21-like isoform X2 n=1 Tax=Limulus polyphemus TaxID=6850 RepID=A0ABM1TDX8_LIMPO|nr:cAMP-regulated phosphoprotein 21-like isoform X2 [Limulus polyphemus]
MTTYFKMAKAEIPSIVVHSGVNSSSCSIFSSGNSVNPIEMEWKQTDRHVKLAKQEGVELEDERYSNTIPVKICIEDGGGSTKELECSNRYDDDAEKGEDGDETTSSDGDASSRTPSSSGPGSRQSPVSNHVVKEKPQSRAHQRVKLLVRSQAVRDDLSPPPDLEGLSTNNNMLSVTNVSTFTVQTQTKGSSNRHKLKKQGSSQGSVDESSPTWSRDSSTETYTDSTGINLQQFIIETLHKNQKDRLTMLKIEQEIISLIKDSKRQSFKFPHMSSYHRMLVHRVAAYFGLDHNVDQNGTAVIVNKTKNTRLPETKFNDLIHDELVPDEPKKLILKRDSVCFEDGKESPERQSSVDSRKSKSIEEREEEYEKARARIFNQDSCSSLDGNVELLVAPFQDGLPNSSLRSSQEDLCILGVDSRPWSSTDSDSSGRPINQDVGQTGNKSQGIILLTKSESEGKELLAPNRDNKPLITKASSFAGISVLTRDKPTDKRSSPKLTKSESLNVTNLIGQHISNGTGCASAVVSSCQGSPGLTSSTPITCQGMSVYTVVASGIPASVVPQVLNTQTMTAQKVSSQPAWLADGKDQTVSNLCHPPVWSVSTESVVSGNVVISAQPGVQQSVPVNGNLPCPPIQSQVCQQQPQQFHGTLAPAFIYMPYIPHLTPVQGTSQQGPLSGTDQRTVNSNLGTNGVTDLSSQMSALGFTASQQQSQDVTGASQGTEPVPTSTASSVLGSQGYVVTPVRPQAKQPGPVYYIHQHTSSLTPAHPIRYIYPVMHFLQQPSTVISGNVPLGAQNLENQGLLGLSGQTYVPTYPAASSGDVSSGSSAYLNCSQTCTSTVALSPSVFTSTSQLTYSSYPGSNLVFTTLTGTASQTQSSGYISSLPVVHPPTANVPIYFVASGDNTAPLPQPSQQPNNTGCTPFQPQNPPSQNSNQGLSGQVPSLGSVAPYIGYSVFPPSQSQQSQPTLTAVNSGTLPSNPFPTSLMAPIPMIRPSIPFINNAQNNTTPSQGLFSSPFGLVPSSKGPVKPGEGNLTESVEGSDVRLIGTPLLHQFNPLMMSQNQPLPRFPNLPHSQGTLPMNNRPPKLRRQKNRGSNSMSKTTSIPNDSQVLEEVGGNCILEVEGLPDGMKRSEVERFLEQVVSQGARIDFLCTKLGSATPAGNDVIFNSKFKVLAVFESSTAAQNALLNIKTSKFQLRPPRQQRKDSVKNVS